MGGDGGARAAAGLAQPLGVGEQLVDALGEALDVPGGNQHEAVARGGDLLGPGLPAAADRGQPAGHRLDVGDPERLLGGGHREQGAAARALERLLGGQLPAQLHALADPEADGEPFERDPLGAVADDRVAQGGVSWGEHGERAQHVGVALAGDEVPDGDQCVVPVSPTLTLGAACGEVRPEVHHPHLPGAVGAGELGDAAAVGEHEAGGAQSACDGRAAGRGAGGGVEHVAAVHGDHERHVEPGAAHGLTGGHGVVGVD